MGRTVSARLIIGGNLHIVQLLNPCNHIEISLMTFTIDWLMIIVDPSLAAIVA
jgi:hypothetical protein